jgi:predicted DNA-binding transcriptional regulator YafY
MGCGQFLSAMNPRMTPMSTSSRMLRLLSLLQTHRFWAGSELAGRLEVSERTLRRDIDRLRELGYPVDATRGVAGGYQLAGGSELPPLLLDDDEAIAIAVGLRAASGGAVAGIEDSSIRALTKVVRMLPLRLRRRVDALRVTMAPAALAGPGGSGGGGPQVDAAALAVIAQAAQDGEQLRFDYTARDGTSATRTVEPHRLVTLGRRWYLVAWDLDRADWRSFRVDRLTDPRSARYRFAPREIPGGDALAFVQQGLRSMPTRYGVDVTIHAPAASVSDWLGGWAQVESLDDGSCRMRMAVDALDWPVMILAALDADVVVHTPTELRDRLGGVARRFERASAV